MVIGNYLDIVRLSAQGAVRRTVYFFGRELFSPRLFLVFPALRCLSVAGGSGIT